MNRSWVRFATGFALGAAIAVALNLIPYWLTFRDYAGDSYEVIGFPFVFRRVGGYSFSYTFLTDLLLVDIAVAVSFALVVGCLAIVLPRFMRRHGRGFPVVARSEGSAAAE